MNSLIVYEHTHPRQRHFTSKSPFFSGEIVVKIDENKMVFKKPSIDYNGKTHKPNLSKSGYYHTAIVCEVPPGEYDFDPEESNEDCLVIYYK